MECEKCQDKGFTEQEHGLIMVLCDCDKAREVAEKAGLPWREDDEGESLSDVAAEANAFANALMPKLEGEERDDGRPKYLIIPEPLEGKTIDETADIAREIIEASYDRNNRTERDNPDIGSTDTSQSKLTRKPKAKKKARARAG